MYPGTPQLIGSEENFWVWSSDSCNYIMTPDAPIRAYKDSDDKINVIISHYSNYKIRGTTFDNLTADCSVILSSNWDTDPSKHDTQHWIIAPYTDDGTNVHALVHNENSTRTNDSEAGQYYSTSIVYYSSSDGGATWSRPSDYVVYSESDNTTGQTHDDVGHIGVEIKSNILKHSGYYYALIESTQIEINNGRAAQSLTYIIRTNNLSDPDSWRGWDGTGYNIVLGDRYNETINTNSLTPLNKGTVWEGNVAYHNESLVYSTFFEKFMIIGVGKGGSKLGLYYTLSDDLIHWSQRILVKEWDTNDYIVGEADTRVRSNSQYRISYSSIIDHTSTSRNFSTVGEEAYLYWVENQPNGGAATCPNGLSCGAYDRKAKRQKVKFIKREVSEFIVDGAGDLEDTKQGDGVATTSAGKTSLRAALLENRYRPPWATDYVLTIKFNLPASDKIITPASNFLEPEWPFILDGTTESGYVTNTSSFSDGLNFNPVATIDGESGIINLKAGNSEIKGMDIFSVTAQGNNNKITNSIIQTLTVEGKNNTIGIKDSGPNLIYRNIVVKGDSNTIQGNYVGTNKAGSAIQTVISHSDPLIGLKASYNTIDNNLIAFLGASHDGIEIGGTSVKHNTIKNNYVGIKPDGSAAFSTKGANGIEVNGNNATNNTIESNVIGGNQVGINIMDANNNEVYSNKIGIGPSNENLINDIGIWINGTSSSNSVGSESKPNNIQNNTTGLSFLTTSAENDVYANTIHSNATNIFNDQTTDFSFHSIGLNSTSDSIHLYLDSLSSAVEWIEFYGSDTENAREGKAFSKKITSSAVSNLLYSLPKNFNTSTYPYLTTIVKKSGKNISNYNESKKILSVSETPQIALSTTSIIEDHSSTTNTGVDIILSNNGNYPLKWYVTGENEHSYLEPDNGTVDASSSTTVSVTFDSRDLPDQDTSFVITFKSNDINNPKKDLTVGFEFDDDTNRSPVIADQTFSINENSANSTWIGAVVASDPDGDDLTFSIQGGTGVGTFAIDNLGNLSVANSANLDYEVNNSLFIGVVVNDGTETAIATITVNINDVIEIGDNHAPVISDQTFSVDENVSNETWVEAVIATDPDGDDLTFAITGGSGENTFKIDNLGNLSVKDNTALDYETNTSLTITVQVSDGSLSSDATITININDKNDDPSNTPPEMDDQTFTVEENVSDGTGIGSVIASDADGDDLTFSITGGSGNSTFNIDNDGNLAVSDNSALDYETNTSLTLFVSVSDGNASNDATMTINITDVDEVVVTPTVTLSVDSTSIAEASGVATITATLDKEPNSGEVVVTLTVDGTSSASDYTLSSSSITISSGTKGTAMITAVQDTENEDNETVIVDISSVVNGSESGSQQVTVTITDDDDDVVSGFENISLMQNIIVYPNPVNKSNFNIENNSEKILKVVFYSTTGKLVLSKKLKLGNNRFSTKKFNQGIQHIIFTENSTYVGQSKISINK